MKKKLFSIIIALVIMIEAMSLIVSAWTWSIDGGYQVATYNAVIVEDGNISLDGQMDHLYLGATKIVADPVSYYRSYSTDVKALANGSFEAYVAADTKGMYIYVEIVDSTIFDTLNDNGNDGDYLNIYFDWLDTHPEPDKRSGSWSSDNYMSTYGKDQNLGWLSTDYMGNIKGSRGFYYYNQFGVNKNQSAVCKTRLTDDGWACEWFIPWKDQTQINAIAKGQSIPCDIGFQVGDDSSMNDSKEQDVAIRFDQRYEIGLSYYLDYSTLANLNFVKSYDTTAKLCTKSGLSDRYCDHCGVLVAERIETKVAQGAPESHVFIPSKDSRAATCEEEGVELLECKYCQATEETALPALGHSYEYSKREAKHICITCRDRADHGDVDGDGEITNADVLAIYRYIYDPAAYPVDELNISDVDGDGEITNADVLAIYRYIYDPAAYPVTEKLPETPVDGKNLSDYVIIYPEESTYGEKELAAELAAAIKEKFGLEMEVYADSFDVFEHEIIIGRADRAESDALYSAVYEYDQYKVSVSDTKIALGYADNKFAPAKAATELKNMLTVSKSIESKSGRVTAEKLLNSACFSDMHNTYTMLEPNNSTGDYVLRKTHVRAVELIRERYGLLDVVLVGGDLMSDYPSWNSSGHWPYRYYTEYKQLLVDLFAGLTKDGKVMYNAGNHDYAQGEAATDGPGIGGSYNSSDFYFDGPMDKTLGELAPEDMHMVVGTHTGEKYLLGYHYEVNGVHFFGIAPDPDHASVWSVQGYGIHKDTLRWFKETLDRIDPNGDEIIFVNCHFPIAERSNDVIKRCSAEADFIPIIKDHRNLFWMFGHHHTGEQEVAQSHTSEMIVHYDSNGKTVETPAIATSYGNAANRGPTSVYMGAGRIDYNSKYFDNDRVYGDGGSGKQNQTYGSTSTPKICQVMYFTVYEDRVEFLSINVGTYEGYTENDMIEPYTVYFYK